MHYRNQYQVCYVRSPARRVQSKKRGRDVSYRFTVFIIYYLLFTILAIADFVYGFVYGNHG